MAFVHGDIEDLPDGPYDGACSNFGALNCVDLERVGARLAAVLRPGAPVVFSVMGRVPLPDVLRRASRMRGEPRRDGDVLVAGRPVAVRYPSAADVAAAFGPAFRWTRTEALGVLLPGPAHRSWVEAHPQAFGLLAMAERLVRRLPGLRACGDHILLEGHRA